MIGNIWGIAESATKAILDRLGITTGGAYTPPGGGSVPSDWVEASDLSELNAAISGGAARVLLTANITVSSTNQISLPSNAKVVISRQPGFQIIHTGSAALFTYGSGAELAFFDPYEDGLTTPFIDASGASATYLFTTTDSSYRLRVTGDHFSVDCDAFTLRGTGPVDISCERVTLVLPNGAVLSGSVTWDVGRLELVGGGSSCYATIAGNAARGSRIGALRLSGTFRAVSTSGIAEPAVTLSGSMFVDAISGAAGASSYVMVDEGVIVGVSRLESGGIALRNAAILGGYIPLLQVADVGSFGAPKSLVQAATIGQFAYTVTRAVFHSCIISEDATPVSLGSGSECELLSSTIPSGLTLTCASGSGCRIENCDIEGTLVLSSGAACRLVGNRGAGTLTNSDPLSIVTLSETISWDTTPSTRRYGNATLDALLDNHVAYWSGKSVPCPNKAPIAACNAGGNLFSVTGNVLVVSDAFDLVDPTDQMMALLNGWAPGYGPFTMRLDIDLDVTSGGEENIIGDGTGNFSLNLLSSGALRIYVGATYYNTSSSAITIGGGNQRVTIERTGTTLKIYVNGVQVLTTTDTSLIGPISYFYLGGVGSNSIDGKVKKITLLNTGIADATEQLWDTYSLVGAGA